MVEWINVAQAARVGLEEVMIEANEILASLPLTRHNLILALLLSASPQKERERGGEKTWSVKRKFDTNFACYIPTVVGRRGREWVVKFIQS